MPKSKDMPQQRAARVPLQLRTVSSESDSTHPANRGNVDRSPKLGDRRSPRGPLAEKKKGGRITELELQLGQTQEELKKTKEQLASTEAAKREAEQKLEETRSQTPVTVIVEPSPEITETQENGSNFPAKPASEEEFKPQNENEEILPETDVFEVVLPEVFTTEPNVEPSEAEVKEEEPTIVTECCEPAPENAEIAELKAKLTEKEQELEIAELKAKLKEKERELESFTGENDGLKQRVAEAVVEAEAARAKEEEAVAKLSRVIDELEESKKEAARVTEQLRVAEEARLALEAEMKRLRVQTDQWRKAADAAAAVLAAAHDGAELNGRAAGRCGSMDKQLGFEAAHYGGFGSPMADESDDGLGGGKRRGAGLRMFGDLWKKKGQK